MNRLLMTAAVSAVALITSNGEAAVYDISPYNQIAFYNRLDVGDILQSERFGYVEGDGGSVDLHTVEFAPASGAAHIYVGSKGGL